MLGVVCLIPYSIILTKCVTQKRSLKCVSGGNTFIFILLFPVVKIRWDWINSGAEVFKTGNAFVSAKSEVTNTAVCSLISALKVVDWLKTNILFFVLIDCSGHICLFKLPLINDIKLAFISSI